MRMEERTLVTLCALVAKFALYHNLLLTECLKDAPFSSFLGLSFLQSSSSLSFPSQERFATTYA